jgi:hypothetical protein
MCNRGLTVLGAILYSLSFDAAAFLGSEHAEAPLAFETGRGINVIVA